VHGKLKDIYAPVNQNGQESKPSLQSYPFDPLGLDRPSTSSMFVPKFVAPLLRRLGGGWGKPFGSFPSSPGRGCPYGCEFCTVTGFFSAIPSGFAQTKSVVNELLLLKGAPHGVKPVRLRSFFIDDKFCDQYQAHQIAAAPILSPLEHN